MFSKLFFFELTLPSSTGASGSMDLGRLMLVYSGQTSWLSSSAHRK